MSSFDISELGDGHYWQNSDLIVDFPVRFIGDEHDPSNVMIDISGRLIWRAAGGFCEGVTFRRPKIASGEKPSLELLRLDGKGKLDMFQSSFDNEGSSGNVIVATGIGFKGRWENCLFQRGYNGIVLKNGARLDLVEVRRIIARWRSADQSAKELTNFLSSPQCVVAKNERSGVLCEDQSEVRLMKCTVEKNGEHGVSLAGQSRANILRSSILSNKGLAVNKAAGCSSTCSGNFCSKSQVAAVAPPGFQFV